MILVLLAVNILFSGFLYFHFSNAAGDNVYVCNLNKIIRTKKAFEIKKLSAGKITAKEERLSIKKFFNDLSEDLRHYTQNGIVIASQAATAGKKFDITGKILNELNKQKDL
jgi:hypothetical protein